MDGTLGSQTASLLDGSGVRITTGEELAEIILAGAAAGFPVAVHAIGDRANREALDAFEADARDVGAARASSPDRARAARRARRICRASPPSGSPARCSSRMHPPTAISPTASGRARPTARMPTARCWDSGAVVANGSDAPIEELDPLAGIRAGVRRTIDGRGAWHPEQALTVQQAFEATTLRPAWLTGDERRRGKLLPGFAADLVVLDRDPVGGPRRRGRRDDGRRPLGAQPAALALTAARSRAGRGEVTSAPVVARNARARGPPAARGSPP